MNDQIPLYIGIPLAALCVSVVVLVGMLIVAVWKERHE